MTQNPLDCSTALAAISISTLTHGYQNTAATANVGTGFTTLFTHNPVECPILSC